MNREIARDLFLAGAVISIKFTYVRILNRNGQSDLRDADSPQSQSHR